MILFDEPTSALDPEMIREVLDVMRDLAHGGMTMIVVTHEMGLRGVRPDRVRRRGEDRRRAEPEAFFEGAKSQRAKDFVDKILRH